MIGAAASAALTLTGAGAAYAAAPAPWVGPTDVSQPALGSATGCGLINCPGIGGGDIALTPNGDLVAAFTRRDAAGNYHVEAVSRPAGGTFGAPRDLGLAAVEPDPTNRISSRPSPVEVEVDDAGVPVITFLGPVDGKRVVKASINLQSPTNVSSPGQDASEAKLAMSPSGEAVAIWVRSNGTSTIAQAAIRPPGGAFGAGQDLSATGKNAHDPAVAIDARGDAAAIWSSDTTGSGIIQAATRNAGGTFSAPPQNLSLPGSEAKLPDVAIDDQGRATAVWQRGNAIQSAARNGAGAFGAVETIAGTNIVDARPKVAVDAQNTAVAIWNNNFVLQSAARPSNGSFGAIQDVSAPNGADGVTPRIVIDRAGNARAVWQSRPPGAIQSARRPAGGDFGGVDTLSAANESATVPNLALDELGNAAVIFARVGFNKADPFTAQIAGFDGSPPTFRELTVTPTAMSAKPFDVWSPVTTRWDFGDGATAAGERVTHQFPGGGTFTVTARARDRFGRETAATRPVTIIAPPVIVPAPPAGPARPAAPAAPRILNNLVGNNWDVRNTRFTLTLLVVRAPIPKGAVAQVRCLGKGCPFKTKRSTKLKKGEIDLLPLLTKKQRKLRAGMTIEVRLTAPGVRGRQVRFALKRNKVPKPVGKTL